MIAHVAGEDAPDKGDDGVRRAKKWLERTTRVKMSWTRHDAALSELLHFTWPYGGQQPFSFDVGGTFAGGSIDGATFMGEVKNYKKELDLPTHFNDFLAKCYVAYSAQPARCDNMLWISWSPFQAQRWDEHVGRGSLHKALKKNSVRALGETEPDLEVVLGVVERIHFITMSPKIEELVILDDYYKRYILPEIHG